jgi:hypothetical protein
LPIRLHPPVITCFLELESGNLNDLELIGFASRAGAREEAPAIPAAGGIRPRAEG